MGHWKGAVDYMVHLATIRFTVGPPSATRHWKKVRDAVRRHFDLDQEGFGIAEGQRMRLRMLANMLKKF